MKANEIRKMSGAELETKLMDLKKDLFNLRLQHATNQLDNPVRIAEVKKDIAPGQDHHPRAAARRPLRGGTDMENRTSSRKDQSRPGGFGQDGQDRGGRHRRPRGSPSV